MLKNIILKFVNKPEDNIISSQTLYESLMATIDLYLITGNDKWSLESKKIMEMIKASQLFDGGFDIGYDFMFGKHLSKSSKKEGTTPEVVSLFALYEYGENFGYEDVEEAIDKGINWIFNNVIPISDTKYAIPYAPHSYDKVHITNGVSFAIGALSYHLKTNVKDTRAVEIYNGMINFMYDELTSSEYGSFWSYFYLSGSSKETALMNNKIDNYHIGQQLRYHSAAYLNFPTEKNKEIVDKVSLYIVNKIDNNGLIMYTENQGKVSNKIDMWGYSSVIKGLVDSYKITNNVMLLEKAKLMIGFITKNAWNGEYFYPILSKEGKVFDNSFYPRSDAWVLHSLCHYMSHIEQNKMLVDICEKNYNKISDCNFTGLENHTLTRRKKYFAKIVWFITSQKAKRDKL